ncbi:hypothetical protein E2C01_083683 [Portunus trituberculatus]|uniref:Uncharacterized protein n=1 Tax=Portunus trituberculatus TaxID=210409 RepID=A0A5B7J2T6_PORTR|nr:hypothetical protein [Portunus trituberculatus]
MLWGVLSGSARVLRRRLAVNRVYLALSGRGKDLSGGWIMNETVTLDSRDDYFLWERAVLRWCGRGVVVIRRKVGVRWYCRETGSGGPEVMATQVDKTMLIGPEVSQPQCCKNGGGGVFKLAVSAHMSCPTLLSVLVDRIRPVYYLGFPVVL